MEIRPLTTADLEQLRDIDATIEASRYLHVDRSGGDLNLALRLEERPIREPRIEPNPLSEDTLFSARQIASGFEEGLALVTEHNDTMLALLLAQPDPVHNVLRLLDIRVDFDYRRQGMGTALGYMLLQHARDRELRAVKAESPTDNLPAAQFLLKAGFKLAGLDTQRHSNHDLVKERATLLWYAAVEK